MSFDVLKHTYAVACPTLAPEAIEAVVEAALVRAQEKHPDFERFAPAMEFLATVFFTDHTHMPLDDYLETLYCGVKHGDYSKGWRADLRRAKATPAPVVEAAALVH